MAFSNSLMRGMVVRRFDLYSLSQVLQYGFFMSRIDEFLENSLSGFSRKHKEQILKPWRNDFGAVFFLGLPASSSYLSCFHELKHCLHQLFFPSLAARLFEKSSRGFSVLHFEQRFMIHRLKRCKPFHFAQLLRPHRSEMACVLW